MGVLICLIQTFFHRRAVILGRAIKIVELAALVIGEKSDAGRREGPDISICFFQMFFDKLFDLREGQPILPFQFQTQGVFALFIHFLPLVPAGRVANGGNDIFGENSAHFQTDFIGIQKGQAFFRGIADEMGLAPPGDHAKQLFVRYLIHRITPLYFLVSIVTSDLRLCNKKSPGPLHRETLCHSKNYFRGSSTATACFTC